MLLSVPDHIFGSLDPYCIGTCTKEGTGLIKDGHCPLGLLGAKGSEKLLGSRGVKAYSASRRAKYSLLYKPDLKTYGSTRFILKKRTQWWTTLQWLRN